MVNDTHTGMFAIISHRFETEPFYLASTENFGSFAKYTCNHGTLMSRRKQNCAKCRTLNGEISCSHFGIFESVFVLPLFLFAPVSIDDVLAFTFHCAHTLSCALRFSLNLTGEIEERCRLYKLLFIQMENSLETKFTATFISHSNGVLNSSKPMLV